MKKNNEIFDGDFPARLPLPLLVLEQEDMVIAWANMPAERLLGGSSAEMVGRKVNDFFPRQEKDFCRRLCTQKESEYPQRATLKTLRGAEVPVSLLPCTLPGDNLRMALVILDQSRLVQVEKQVLQLKILLESIRNIKELASREKNQQRFLSKVCVDLVRGRGYNCAWLALFNGENKAHSFAESGLGILPMEESLRLGELCYCARKSLQLPGVIFIPNPLELCGDCLLASIFGQTAGITVRIEFAGRVYGVLNVHLPAEKAGSDEQQLLADIAIDVAMLLHSLETERTLRQAHQEAEQARQLKKDFLGLAAHQLKTPMTPVREGIGILMEEMSAGLTREQKDMLEVIRRNIERIDKAVSRIIILQKLTGGLEDFFFRDTDLKEILDVIFFDLTRLSLLKKLHVEIRHAENLHKVRVDREKVILAYSLLGQVILNFTPHGPVILADGREEKTFFLSVETSSTTLDPQDLAYFTQETAVSYRVSRIASEFFLETAICRETMRRHGGHISAESAAGGIVVRLHFPINTKGNLNNE